jgi:hypothetical protein
MYKKGDRIKFLNEIGGGVVVRMIDTRMVLVAIEDGFEIPVLASEIVHAEPQKENEVSQPKAQSPSFQVNLPDSEEDPRKGKLRRFAKNPEAEGIYLAFVPHEQQWILTGMLDVVLVNHSPAELLYSFSIQGDNEFINMDYGQLGPYNKVSIETIGREQLNHWCRGVVQALLVFDRSRDMYIPMHAPFDIKPGRFYKEGSYIMFGILGEKALHLNLQSLGSLLATNNLPHEIKFDREAEPVRKHRKEPSLIDKHRTTRGEAVVDLHIGELLDNIAGLSSKDMFHVQLDYFRKTLDSAIEQEYDKVTYIHGVGNGVLKQAIINALDAYEGTASRMASVSKFGVGAIEVLIKDKD